MAGFDAAPPALGPTPAPTGNPFQAPGGIEPAVTMADRPLERPASGRVPWYVPERRKDALQRARELPVGDKWRKGLLRSARWHRLEMQTRGVRGRPMTATRASRPLTVERLRDITNNWGGLSLARRKTFPKGLLNIGDMARTTSTSSTAKSKLLQQLNTARAFGKAPGLGTGLKYLGARKGKLGLLAAAAAALGGGGYLATRRSGQLSLPAQQFLQRTIHDPFEAR